MANNYTPKEILHNFLTIGASIYPALADEILDKYCTDEICDEILSLINSIKKEETFSGTSTKLLQEATTMYSKFSESEALENLSELLEDITIMPINVFNTNYNNNYYDMNKKDKQYYNSLDDWNKEMFGKDLKTLTRQQISNRQKDGYYLMDSIQKADYRRYELSEYGGNY